MNDEEDDEPMKRGFEIQVHLYVGKVKAGGQITWGGRKSGHLQTFVVPDRETLEARLKEIGPGAKRFSEDSDIVLSIEAVVQETMDGLLMGGVLDSVKFLPASLDEEGLWTADIG